MTDQDHPDESEGRIEEPRSEGVRIIGAQEAAEAAGRPDVARRRRRGEKRFGDRPDEPEAASDLPKVRISTSEHDPAVVDPGDAYGAVPVVPGRSDEPRWADDDFAATPDEDARSYGHARVVPPEAESTPPPDAPAEPTSDLPPHEQPSLEEPADDPAVPAPEPFGEDPSRWEPADEPIGEAAWRSAERSWGDVDEPAPLTDSYLEPADEAGAPSAFAEDDDDSFVLPHWTEPPTGQVPKVVIAEDPFEGDAAGYGSQPRWRDEGERTVETDFDDLRDDAPLLGALAGSQLPDPDEEIDFFDSEVDRDPLEAFADDAAFGDDADFGDESVTRRRTATRRRPRRTAERGGGEGDDDGSAGGGGSGGGDRNLVTAVIVGVALVLVGVACFILGGLATTVLACVIVGAAAYEFFGAVESRGFQPAALLGLVATIGLLVATYFSGLNAYPVVLTLTVVLGLLWYLWVTPGEHSVRNLGITLLGVMWIGFLGSFATLFLGLGKVLEDSHPKMTSNIGIGVLIAAVVATVAHDIGAYFVGQYAGKTPMSAASPNKTLEGLVGGVVCSIVATVVIVGFFSIHPIGGDIFRVFVFAVLCAAVAPLGDLCESFIKRDLGLKDMGSVLPGHGGVLDRFDALLFVLPTAYFATLLFNTWAG